MHVYTTGRCHVTCGAHTHMCRYSCLGMCMALCERTNLCIVHLGEWVYVSRWLRMGKCAIVYV